MTTATYACDDGYYLDGPEKLTCLPNGSYGNGRTGEWKLLEIKLSYFDENFKNGTP